MRIDLAALAAIAMIAAGGAAAEDMPATSPLSETERQMIAEAVGERLKDPDSAKFNWLDWAEPANPTGEASYCAKVNAKNSYGGYSGYVVFQATVSMKDRRPAEVSNVALADDNGGYVSMIIKERCMTAGYGDLFPGLPTVADLTKQMQDETARLNRQIEESAKESQRSYDDAMRRLKGPVE